jgi:hypothetical protein
MSEDFLVLSGDGGAYRGWRVLFALGLYFVCLAAPGHVLAEFDSTGWKRYREIQITKPMPKGLLGVPLESAILERSRPDCADIRIVTSGGSLVPAVVMGSVPDEDTTMLPVSVFKTSRKAGKWTDIWIDKTAKTLTRGILIQTSSKDFVRKVEIRGADNSAESYVVRLDGLIADLVSPIPIRSLSVFHPENNFRYLHVRIVDEDRPPLTLAGIACYVPASEASLVRSLPVRIVENRQGHGGGSTVLVVDLGEKRLPLTKLTVHTPVSQFVKKIVLSAGSSLSSESWEKIFEGVVFRVRKDESVTESLEIQTKPQTKRYLKMEFSEGDARSLPVDKIEASGNLPLVVFEYDPTVTYRLYYDNPRGVAINHPGAPPSFNLAHVAATSSAVALGSDQRNTEPVKTKVAGEPHDPIPSLVRKGLGILMLLIGLLFLFSLMLRSLSRRRQNRRRVTRTADTRV